MKSLTIIVAIALAASVRPSFAHGTSHFNFGEPGIAQKVSKTYRFQLTDSMRFVTKDKIAISRGDTVKFVVTNSGKVKHEFSLGDAVFQKEHAEMMKAMPDMVHTDPNTVTVEPGATRELIWTFSKRPPSGIVQVGCHVPGHYEAGMKFDLPIKP